ncbi:mCG1040427 [Mus musculus]|nr:mCG1040427 [Mus musculus]
MLPAMMIIVSISEPVVQATLVVCSGGCSRFDYIWN